MKSPLIPPKNSPLPFPLLQYYFTHLSLFHCEKKVKIHSEVWYYLECMLPLVLLKTTYSPLWAPYILVYGLAEANKALLRLKEGKVHGAAVLSMSSGGD